jgi:hypothetical protein
MMRHSDSIYILFIFLMLSSACNRTVKGSVSQRPKMQNHAELASWVQDNKSELVNSRTIEDIEVQARYMPSSAESNSEFNFLLNISSKKGDNLLSLQNTNYSSNESKIMYWSSGVGKHLLLVTDVDTMPCSAVVYENLGSIKNDISVNIGFSSKLNNHKTYRLVYDDVYFSLGRLNFTFDNIINQVPLIETSN